MVSDVNIVFMKTEDFLV